ncbi:MAG: hypothetical protein AB1486_05395 [Planctomycetota bacterium]
MWRAACMAVVVIMIGAPARGEDSPASTENVTNTDGVLEGFTDDWIPRGPEDYFNTRFDMLAGRPVSGVSIASADFGSGGSYPVAGLFDANLSLDPSGNTPDLARGYSTGPVPGSGSPIYDYVFAGFGRVVTAGPNPQHVVAQLPPGYTRLVILMDYTAPQLNFSGLSRDGYQTPARSTWADIGLNVNVDAVTELQGGRDGRLRVFTPLTDERGDFTTLTIRPGYTPLGFVFFAPFAGSLWVLFSSAGGGPVTGWSAPIPTTPDGPGGYTRTGGVLPPVFGDVTFRFVAISGVPGVLGTIGISNEVTVHALPATWGAWDDGTYDHGWVISHPGPSDYFSVNLAQSGNPPANITHIDLAVMDFGTHVTAFPMSGAFPANFTLDASGNTPDLSHPYDAAPHPFPPGVFATTSGQLVSRAISPPIPYASLTSDNVHAVVRLPPYENLLTVGTDTGVEFISGKSAWTQNGYSTPALRMDGGDWGIRLGGN